MSQDTAPQGSVSRFVLLADLVALVLALALLPLAQRLTPAEQVLEATVFVLVGCVVITIVGQWSDVKVRHGVTAEELTFFEAVFAAAMLIMAPIPLFVAALFGVLLSELAVRRPPIKLAFNLGLYAASTSSMLFVYHLLNGNADVLGLRSTVSLLISALVFAAVDLAFIAALLHATAGASRWEVAREEWRLSAFMAVGSVGVGSVAVALAKFAPALLPFAALPALALWYAYSAAAQHAEARERNRWLVEMGGLLAEHGRGDNTLQLAASAIQNIVGAPKLLVLNPLRPDKSSGPEARSLLKSFAGQTGPRELPSADLPRGWANGVIVSLDVGASEPGAIVIGSDSPYRRSRMGRSSGWRMEDADAPVVGALAAALGSSLRAGATFNALAEETAKLTAVVDNTSDGIAMVDDTGRVRLWSQTMARMTGVSGDELTAVEDPASMPRVVQSLLRSSWNAEDAAGSRPANTRVHLERPDGEELEVLVSTVRVQESATSAAGDTAGWVSILTVHDETRERRVDQMKTDFVATISHELRTPITPIKGYAHLLAKRGDRLSPEKRAQALQTISDRADHLTRLIDDLLLASRVSDGARLAVEIGVEDLADIVSQAVDSFPRMADRIRTDLPTYPVQIQCDRVRAVQCLSNLLGNAEKYTPPGSPIDIHVEVTPMLVGIHVRDHGPGIPAAEQAHVFDRFYRLENPLTMKTGGAGLGLHIARELAIAMGGGLTLRDAAGGGAEFVLHLPTVDAPSVGMMRATDPQAAPLRPRPAPTTTVTLTDSTTAPPTTPPFSATTPAPGPASLEPSNRSAQLAGNAAQTTRATSNAGPVTDIGNLPSPPARTMLLAAPQQLVPPAISVSRRRFFSPPARPPARPAPTTDGVSAETVPAETVPGETVPGETVPGENQSIGWPLVAAASADSPDLAPDQAQDQAQDQDQAPEQAPAADDAAAPSRGVKALSAGTNIPKHDPADDA